ncbi:dnaJ subfamily C 1 [Echinococcus multilocularis]|uniref:DnaJ subfamily C 1 n=1 Tax=Echinococcus multilocularis TaxID=6211 RepID=A0A068YAK1_ECHMU|nr:dnaJ subfamily C 1 [Echinococcus multilocularis]
MYAESGSPRQTSDFNFLLLNDSIDVDDEDSSVVDPSLLSFVEEQAGLGGASSAVENDVEFEDPTPDLYAVLGVARDANEAELKAAYRRLSRLLHPDKHTRASAAAEAAFGRLTAAYNILSDPHRRAIYDQYGFRGLRIQGWELAVRDKSAPELRLEYLLLKQKAKEAESEHLLQPTSELSCGVDMTDFFDRYLKESPEERMLSPSLSVYDVSVSQSVTALRTPYNTVSLVGQVTTHNGIGIGTLFSLWVHRLSPKTPIIGASSTETTLSYGRGGYGLGASVKLNKQLHERVTGSVGLEAASVNRNNSAIFSLIPGFSLATNIQVTPHIVTRLQYKFNLSGGFSSEVVWASEKGERSCRVQTHLRHDTASLKLHFESLVDWPWLNPLLKPSTPSRWTSKKSSADWDANLDEEDDLVLETIPQKGRISASLSCNIFDLLELRVGANCVLSELSRVSSEIGISWLRGLSMKLGLHRGDQSYVLQIKLSDNLDPAAFTYGVLVPSLTYCLVRSLVYEPWVLAQLTKAQEIRRQRLRGELRQLRSEALATQALMQHTSSRVARAEKESGGLVIVYALYGQLSSTTPGIPLTADAGGALSIDVTVPLQVIVENHQIRLPPGRWADMQGFYDPCAGLGRAACHGRRPLRQLFVAYTFNGLPHEVCTEESAGLAIPLSKHRVDTFSEH